MPPLALFTPWCLGGVFLPPAGLSTPRTPAGHPRSHRTRGWPAGSTGRASQSHTTGCGVVYEFFYGTTLILYVVLAMIIDAIS